jgi:hypothetical protein
MTEYIEAAFGVIKATDQSGKPVALCDLINNVFNDGRSALAHGEAFGLLSDRSADRARADVIVQELIEQVTEPLAAVVQQRDRMLTIDKDAQVKAFKARLAHLASAREA